MAKDIERDQITFLNLIKTYCGITFKGNTSLEAGIFINKYLYKAMQIRKDNNCHCTVFDNYYKQMNNIDKKATSHQEAFVPATDRQLSYISSIERKLNVKFKGKSMTEASDFISKNVEAFKTKSNEQRQLESETPVVTVVEYECCENIDYGEQHNNGVNPSDLLPTHLGQTNRTYASEYFGGGHGNLEHMLDNANFISMFSH